MINGKLKHCYIYVRFHNMILDIHDNYLNELEDLDLDKAAKEKQTLVCCVENEKRLK